MKTFELKNRYTSAVLFTGEGETLRDVVAIATDSRADLTGADLSRADLSRADLTGADLTGADLTGADLTGADLTGANLSRADLTGANLYGADIGEHGKLITSNSIFQCGPIGSRQSYLVAYLTDNGIVITAGCFIGFIDDFEAKVNSTHGDNQHAKEYALAVTMIKGIFQIRGNI